MDSGTGSNGAVRLQFSHRGLFVTDMVAMTDFYHRVLGFPITDRGYPGEAELVFFCRDPRDHHQTVPVAGRPPGRPDKIVNQVSFRVGSLGELKRFYTCARAEIARKIAADDAGMVNG